MVPAGLATAWAPTIAALPDTVETASDIAIEPTGFEEAWQQGIAMPADTVEMPDIDLA